MSYCEHQGKLDRLLKRLKEVKTSGFCQTLETLEQDPVCCGKFNDVLFQACGPIRIIIISNASECRAQPSFIPDAANATNHPFATVARRRAQQTEAERRRIRELENYFGAAEQGITILQCNINVFTY